MRPLSPPFRAAAQRFWHRFPLYWQRLSLLLSAVAGAALLNTLLLTPFIESRATLILLASFTGGVLLTPFVYLIFDYLRQQHRYQLLGLETRHPPLRTSLLLWCSLFFIIGIGTQMVLSPEIERLLLIVVFLPNVVMAWKFGWQGGVLAALLGSMMITTARQVGSGFSDLMELEIFSPLRRCWASALASLSAARNSWPATSITTASGWKWSWMRGGRLLKN
ncbi:putative sensor histidine protein kinase (uhpB-like) [Atlantibacter hermannii]|nr:putative sensor histidine protein kinase (uhpB-like) [Atlantibacter hermannii]